MKMFINTDIGPIGNSFSPRIKFVSHLSLGRK
jgi:hypothetical protein